MDLKSILKSIKLNESSISMVLGAVVILIVGVLVVNYFRQERTEQVSNGVMDEQVEEVSETPKSGSTYKVKEGESLWEISESAYGSGFEWEKIANANNLEHPGDIEVGQTLTIPQLDQEVTLGDTTQDEAPSSMMGDTYTVVRGDSLWDIAVRAYGDGYKWVSIANANNLTNPDIIHAGNVLTLPR